jgi:hypothetical protein
MASIVQHIPDFIENREFRKRGIFFTLRGLKKISFVSEWLREEKATLAFDENDLMAVIDDHVNPIEWWVIGHIKGFHFAKLPQIDYKDLEEKNFPRIKPIFIPPRAELRIPPPESCIHYKKCPWTKIPTCPLECGNFEEEKK